MYSYTLKFDVFDLLQNLTNSNVWARRENWLYAYISSFFSYLFLLHQCRAINLKKFTSLQEIMR